MSDVKKWLTMLHERKGSDLFITVNSPPCLKVHGVISPITDAGLSAEDAKRIVLSIMTPEQRKRFIETHELNFAIALGDIARFRVNAFFQRGKVGMVCRRIETRIPGFEELDLPDILKDLAIEKRGIIIYVGATGSGKSTSLAAMVGYRNRRMTGHIISIEDPIEYVHQHGKCLITQREVGVDKESFEIALRNTLRQAPDVIMIGEIRTRESMEHALTFAETGHLCLSTLHANNANQALDRILHFFQEDVRDQVLLDLSFNLKAIVAQQLIPSVDGSRRWVAVEVMLNTPLMQEKIRKGKIHELKELIQQSTHHGMMTFDQSLLNLYQAGRISYEEALRHADSPNDLRLAVKLSEGGDFESLSRGMEGVQVMDAE